jgi:hypothetical protein
MSDIASNKATCLAVFASLLLAPLGSVRSLSAELTLRVMSVVSIVE